MRGPRDGVYSGYLLRENPWLQLQSSQRAFAEDAFS
jgi:hypothetical protein